jgi:Cu/Ag efflux pump CusA
MYKLAISRPITTLMFVFALVFFGYTQMQKMPIAFLPNVDYPVVSIVTTYDQGSTEIIESKTTVDTLSLTSFAASSTGLLNSNCAITIDWFCFRILFTK